MKRYIIIGLMAWTLPLYSQEAQTVRELVDAVRQETGQAVYCHPSLLDKQVTVEASGETTDEQLRKAVEKLGGQVTAWPGVGLFVLPEQQLITSLPPLFAQDTTRYESYAGMSRFRQGEKATSENKVYEVGGGEKQADGRALLSGTVTDFKTGNAVVGATLVVRSPWKATTTDADGRFELALVPGKYELQIAGVDIQETRRQIDLRGNGELDIVLEERQYELQEVTVSAGLRDNTKDVQMSVTKLQVKEIRKIPTAFGEVDVLRAVQALPGVTTAGEASSGLNVRGGATDQNLILFNEGTIYNPTHLFGFFSAINSDMVESVELYKSSIPSRYGGRISSVLDMQGREGNMEKFTGSAGIGLLTSRLTLETPIVKGRTSLLLSGRTTYSDWLLNALPEKSGYNDGNAGFYDIGGTLSHRFNRKSSLRLNGYYSNDRFSFSDEDKYKYHNLNASARWTHVFHEGFVSNLTAGYDHYDYETEDLTTATAAYRLSFDIDQYFAKWDFRHDLTADNQLNYGVNVLFYNVNPGTYLPASDSSLVVADQLEREKALESALYVGDTWNITSDLSVEAGVRLSMFNALGSRTYNIYEAGTLPSEETLIGSETAEKGKAYKTYLGPEFRVSARYMLNDDLSVKAGFNSMRQYIHKISNSTVMSPTDTWKLSDLNIRPQQGWQVAAGIYWNPWGGTLETSLEGYYKKLTDYLDYRDGAELSMNHHLETDVINTEGKAYGIEAMIRKPQGNLNGWLSYTYSKTLLRQNDPRIESPVNDGAWYPAEYDKPHNFKFVGNYMFTKRYSLSLNCEYSTGRPVTLPASKYYDHQIGSEIVYYADRNSTRVSDYFRMDIAFNIEPSHKLTLLTHSSFSIGIYNVTGRKNVYSVYYETDRGQIKGYRMSIFGVPIPYITYNIKF